MTQEHPNVALLKRLDLGDLSGCADLFADDFVWHYFNSRLPDLEGDYVGVDGLKAFFEQVWATSAGTFRVDPVSITPVGDELLVVHAIDNLAIEGKPLELDVVVVWRIVEGRIAEAWDIPSVHTARSQVQ